MLVVGLGRTVLGESHDYDDREKWRGREEVKMAYLKLVRKQFMCSDHVGPSLEKVTVTEEGLYVQIAGGGKARRVIQAAVDKMDEESKARDAGGGSEERRKR